jgi:hypothetical protein
LPLKKIGANKKALKASFNAVVLEGHLYPKRRLLNDYHHIAQQALKPEIQEFCVAGTALLNISREYQMMGAMSAALQFANRSIAILERNFGSFSHGMALAHRCDLLISLSRAPEARIDFDMASAFEFKEIQGALKLLAPKLTATSTPADVPDDELLPTWRERRPGTSEGNKTIKLSFLESKLIAFLSRRSRDKVEIMNFLYGRRLPSHVRANRMKSMMSTLRKKSPGSIVFENGKYKIVDPIYKTGGESA